MADEKDDGTSEFVQHEVTDVERTEEGKAASEAAVTAEKVKEDAAKTVEENVDDNSDDAADAGDTDADTGSGDGEGDSKDGADDDGESDESGEGSGDSGDDVGEEGAGDTAGEDEDEDEQKPKKKRSPAERIAQVTKNWREAERASDAKDTRIAELERQLTAKTGDDTKLDSSSDDAVKRPDPDDFTYGELDPDYTVALTSSLVEEGMAKARATDETTRQEEAARQETEEFQTNYQARVIEGIEAYDDFETVVIKASDNNEFPLSEEMARMAVASPVGHHVIYDIASDLPLATKIAQMTPIEQAQEFGRLAARHTSTEGSPTPKPNKIPQAKTPPKKRVGGNSAKSFDPVSATFTEFEDKVNADLAKQKRF